MNSPALKKWMVLLALLLVTLILVWQAPEPEQADIVDPVQPGSRDREMPARSSVSTPTDAMPLSLKPRQAGGQVVDLFAVPSSPKPVKPAVIRRPVKVQEPQKRVELPFSYVGRLRSAQKSTLFLMEGNTLYLVQEGDTVNQDFRLQRIDDSNKELVWLYLPLNETRKMSMDR